MTTSPNLGLSYLVANQAQKEATHNEALNDLDTMAQLCVIDRTLSSPPASPADGATYIVAAAPTGAWSGQANAVAVYFSGWRFKTPKEGWRAYLQNENRIVVYTGTEWAMLGAPQYDATLSWNPGTIATGAGATSSAIAVANAAFGDFVAVAAPYDLQGVIATAYVRAAGSVAIRIQNQTGAGVTLGSGTWRVRVTKA